MSDIYFNAWADEYKRPFGAVAAGEEVTFSIDVNVNQLCEVSLIIRNENGKNQEEKYEMKGMGNHRFSYTFTLREGKGLYYYYFSVRWKNEKEEEQMLFIGSSAFKGEGKLYNHRHETVPFQLTCFEKPEKTPDWYREAVFYQIFPDRFYNGYPNKEIHSPKRNSFIYADTRDTPLYVRGPGGEILRWDFYGGNIEGVRKKIAYLKELGVNAIYFNPIFKAASNHRYDTADYMELDPMLGEEAQFKQLMDELHEEGIHVILDGVFSHVGKNSVYFNYDGTYGEGKGAYQNPESPYVSWFTFKNYPDAYSSWWGIDDLPEVDKSNKEFQNYIYGEENSVLDKWSKLGVDGWRLDVADELPDYFIEGIRRKLDQYPDRVLIGEVWEDASNKIAYDKRRQYILGNHLHGVMNYPLRNIILDLLQLERSPEELCHRLTTLQENYPRDIFFNNLNNIGTHDTRRIYTVLGGDKEKLKLALSFLLTAPGIPCIYYGDEAGLTGDKDPENRKFFPWEAIDQEIFKHCQQWIAERKQNNALKYGDLATFYTSEIFGMLRFTDQSYTIYVINPHDSPKSCDFREIQFLRKAPLTEKVMKENFCNRVIDGKSDLLVTGAC